MSNQKLLCKGDLEGGGGRGHHWYRNKSEIRSSGHQVGHSVRSSNHQLTLFRLFWFLLTVILAAKSSQQQEQQQQKHLRREARQTSNNQLSSIEAEFLSESSIVNQENQELEASKVALECHLRPVVHILQHPGCVPKPIPSFACFGTCSSYVQVSSSKFWQLERSCNCCQEVGEREAIVSLFCPKQMPKFRKVTTRAPVECMCRPCTAVDRDLVKPLELLDISSTNSA